MSIPDTTRLDNLRKLIDQYDGPTALSRRLSYSNPAFIVQMAGPHPSRPITEKTARRIEVALGLPSGWMDTAHRATSSVSEPGVHANGAAKPASSRVDVDADLLRTVTERVATEFAITKTTVDYAKFADVVTLLYMQAVKRGSIDDDLLAAAIRLAKQ